MKKNAIELNKLSNQRLWELFPIILSPHKCIWAKRYETERKRITKAIGPQCIARINHFGSTSVNGLIAKPTIDILMEITDRCPLESLKSELISIGYLFSEQPDNPPPHMLFKKGYTMKGYRGQTFHLHVRYLGDWNELYFRDYLRTHSDVAQEYGELKISLKDKFEHDRDGYTNAKTDFISRYTLLARIEFPGRYASIK